MSLCHLLKQNGLEESRNVTLVERVAIFLWILSGETISRHFHAVLLVVLRLHNVLWYHPEAIPANEPDVRWKWFEVQIISSVQLF
ncbi:hypothetical protein RHMOL_Rhmol06G0251000 [Rhododendron molle]|uniref:Uncharacterized protein n=1 Tax=Rhododendron molle TaxID=49168 RepID=A0ACC0NGQ9_RHOML|nr:hypothetical protein RHMOL_Rhmol06G0251000 [Rhododendron molle]